MFTKDGAYCITDKEFKNVDHIKEELKTLFASNPTAMFDGDLYTHGLTDDFAKIISLVRNTKPAKEHRAEASQLVEYHIYDVVSMSIGN